MVSGYYYLFMWCLFLAFFLVNGSVYRGRFENIIVIRQIHAVGHVIFRCWREAFSCLCVFWGKLSFLSNLPVIGLTFTSAGPIFSSLRRGMRCIADGGMHHRCPWAFCGVLIDGVWRTICVVRSACANDLRII